MWHSNAEIPFIEEGYYMSCDVLGLFENGKMCVIYYDATRIENPWKSAEEGIVLDGPNKLKHWCYLPNISPKAEAYPMLKCGVKI